jgi:hypothetical protein
MTEGFCVNHGRGQVCIRATRVEVRRSRHEPQLAVELCTGPSGNDIRLGRDSNGPKNWNISETQRERLNDAPPHETPMRGILTFVGGPVLQKIRVPFVVRHYESHEVTR